MHRLLAPAAAAAALAAGPALFAADPPAAPPRPWYKRLFAPAAPPAAAPAPQVPTVTKPLPPDVLADAERAERDACLRRLSVCTRLREVAVETNDESLARQADELERQATTLYHQRVASLGLNVPPKTDAATALDRQLGTGAAVNPVAAARTPAADPAAPKTAARGPVKEVAP